MSTIQTECATLRLGSQVIRTRHWLGIKPCSTNQSPAVIQAQGAPAYKFTRFFSRRVHQSVARLETVLANSESARFKKTFTDQSFASTYLIGRNQFLWRMQARVVTQFGATTAKKVLQKSKLGLMDPFIDSKISNSVHKRHIFLKHPETVFVTGTFHRRIGDFFFFCTKSG